MRQLAHARREEVLEPMTPRRRVGERDDDAHVDPIGGDRVEDRVVGRVDEDLAHLAALAHAADVREQRHPLEAMLAEQPQAPRDDRCAAVGGDDEGRAKDVDARVAVPRLDADHVPVVHQDVGHARALAKLHAEGAHAIDQDGVEDLAAKGERVVPIRPPGSDGAIGAGHRRAVGGGDPHAGERRRSRVVHRFQHAEPIEDAERLRAQVLATDLRPRKPRPIEDEDAEAALGEQDRGGRAGGAGADDDDVEAHALTAMTRPSHG